MANKKTSQQRRKAQIAARSRQARENERRKAALQRTQNPPILRGVEWYTPKRVAGLSDANIRQLAMRVGEAWQTASDTIVEQTNNQPYYEQAAPVPPSKQDLQLAKRKTITRLDIRKAKGKREKRRLEYMAPRIAAAKNRVSMYEQATRTTPLTVREQRMKELAGDVDDLTRRNVYGTQDVRDAMRPNMLTGRNEHIPASILRKEINDRIKDLRDWHSGKGFQTARFQRTREDYEQAAGLLGKQYGERVKRLSDTQIRRLINETGLGHALTQNYVYISDQATGDGWVLNPGVGRDADNLGRLRAQVDNFLDYAEQDAKPISIKTQGVRKTPPSAGERLAAMRKAGYRTGSTRRKRK